jgi:hypothetical protein
MRRKDICLYLNPADRDRDPLGGSRPGLEAHGSIKAVPAIAKQRERNMTPVNSQGGLGKSIRDR